MSRGGGRGGFRGGRGGFPGGAAQPPMGLTFTDIQNLSREATALYPALRVPVLSEPTNEEKHIAELQLGFINRLKNSQYYIVEKIKSTELQRYSDKYIPEMSSRPTLRKKDLHEPFFPKDIFEDYFNPKRMKTTNSKSGTTKLRLNLDELNEDGDEQEKSSEERSDAASQAIESDYDVDEEYDNDYAENYFDNGEGDDLNDPGVGDEGGGGGADYD